MTQERAHGRILILQAIATARKGTAYLFVPSNGIFLQDLQEKKQHLFVHSCHKYLLSIY